MPAAIDAAAIATRDAAAPVVDLAGETMGTRWSVRLAAPRGVDIAAVERAVAARLAALVDEMSHWDAASLLSRFNRAAAGSWTVLPPDFAHVVAQALRIAEATGGAFDPAIGRVVDLWGFGPVAVAGPPGDAALAAARATSGWHHLAYDAPMRRLRQPGGCALDLSGIAKGHAVDAVADLLAAHGIAHALVEIGGELSGRGVRPDGDPWWVDLETPPATPATPTTPLRIGLHNLAVATSGDYIRGAHTIDPRTGRATNNGVVSASVIHASALAADAWATALTVLGPVDGLAIATAHGLAARWMTKNAETLSPALVAMLE